MSEPFIGQIIAVPYPRGAPEGWSMCQGQQLQVQQQQALYSLIGLTFGGDQNAFKLPDLRGRSPVGAGPAAGLPGTPFFQLGHTGGGQLEASQVPGHVHPATLGPAGGGAGNAAAQGAVTLPLNASFGPTTVNVSGPLQATTALATQDVPQENWLLGDVQPSNNIKIYASPSAGGTPVSLASIASSGSVSGAVTGNAAGTVNLPVSGAVTVSPNTPSGTPAPVMGPYLVLNMVIAITGLYPSFE